MNAPEYGPRFIRTDYNMAERGVFRSQNTLCSDQSHIEYTRVAQTTTQGGTTECSQRWSSWPARFHPLFDQITLSKHPVTCEPQRKQDSSLTVNAKAKKSIHAAQHTKEKYDTALTGGSTCGAEPADAVAPLEVSPQPQTPTSNRKSS